jgi:hypothetical protein
MGFAVFVDKAADGTANGVIYSGDAARADGDEGIRPDSRGRDGAAKDQGQDKTDKNFQSGRFSHTERPPSDVDVRKILAFFAKIPILVF